MFGSFHDKHERAARDDGMNPMVPDSKILMVPDYQLCGNITGQVGAPGLGNAEPVVPSGERGPRPKVDDESRCGSEVRTEDCEDWQ